MEEKIIYSLQSHFRQASHLAGPITYFTRKSPSRAKFCGVDEKQSRK